MKHPSLTKLAMGDDAKPLGFQVDLSVLPKRVHELAKEVMADGVLDFQRDEPVLMEIIDLLFDDACEFLLPRLPGVQTHNLIDLATHQMLALDDAYDWQAPSVAGGDAEEDRLLTFLVERRVRRLIKIRLSDNQEGADDAPTS